MLPQDKREVMQHNRLWYFILNGGHCLLYKASHLSMLYVTPSRNAWPAIKLLSSLLLPRVIRRWIWNVDCLGLHKARQVDNLDHKFHCCWLACWLSRHGKKCKPRQTGQQSGEWWWGMYNIVLTVSPLWSTQTFRSFLVWQWTQKSLQNTFRATKIRKDFRAIAWSKYTLGLDNNDVAVIDGRAKKH